jgi:hypothetical protein
MASQVWARDPQEAYEEPYEYALQDQFVREATPILGRYYRLLNSDRYRFSVDDQSLEKAIWLLAMDALDSLRDCLDALVRKNHRLAAKLFRDAIESMDLAAFFNGATERSWTCLEKWYRDEIVPHREYRDYLRKTEGPEAAERLAKHYGSLSRFTHRSYRAILDGYSRGGGDRLMHDGTGELLGTSKEAPKLLVLPQTISYYYALLANLILVYSAEISKRGLLTEEEVRTDFVENLETETVPRRFLPRRWLAEKLSAVVGQPPDEPGDELQ